LLSCHTSRPASGTANPPAGGSHPVTSTNGTARTDPFLAGLLKSRPDFFDSILLRPDSFRVQVIYSQIDRQADNSAIFTDYYFNVNPEQYFYPA
jgi:hypothetical protein